MNEAAAIDYERAFTPKQDIHPNLRLSGPPGTSFFDISQDLLIYIRSVLRNDSPMAPEASLDQWTALLDALKCNWIVPLLYRKIGSLPPECRPPKPIGDEMRQSYLLSRVRSLHGKTQLREILDAFHVNSVRVLVLRGPGLAWSLYPDPAMRPSNDLDLLVVPEQMLQARGILESLGYKCLAKRFEVARGFFREECFIHEENPRDNLMVDLHWVHWELHPFFENSRDVEIQDLFQRARKVESENLTFEILDPVDNLIHAAIHSMMIHRTEIRLIWIYDTALIAGQLHVPDEWEALQERSVAWRARLPVEHSLKMAHNWVGLRPPDGFEDLSTWPGPTEDERTVWAGTTKYHWVTILLKRALSRPSILLKRVPSLFRLLFPSPEIVRFCYPVSADWQLPLSYIRRWCRWLESLIIDKIESLKQQR